MPWRSSSEEGRDAFREQVLGGPIYLPGRELRCTSPTEYSVRQDAAGSGTQPFLLRRDPSHKSSRYHTADKARKSDSPTPCRSEGRRPSCRNNSERGTACRRWTAPLDRKSRSSSCPMYATGGAWIQYLSSRLTTASASRLPVRVVLKQSPPLTPGSRTYPRWTRMAIRAFASRMPVPSRAATSAGGGHPCFVDQPEIRLGAVCGWRRRSAAFRRSSALSPVGYRSASFKVTGPPAPSDGNRRGLDRPQPRELTRPSS